MKCIYLVCKSSISHNLDLAKLVRIDDTTPSRIAISHLPLAVHHHIADKELLACTSHGHITEAPFFLFNKWYCTLQKETMHSRQLQLRCLNKRTNVTRPKSLTLHFVFKTWWETQRKSTGHKSKSCSFNISPPLYLRAIAKQYFCYFEMQQPYVIHREVDRT